MSHGRGHDAKNSFFILLPSVSTTVTTGQQTLIERKQTQVCAIIRRRGFDQLNSCLRGTRSQFKSIFKGVDNHNESMDRSSTLFFVSSPNRFETLRLLDQISVVTWSLATNVVSLESPFSFSTDVTDRVESFSPHKQLRTRVSTDRRIAWTVHQWEGNLAHFPPTDDNDCSKLFFNEFMHRNSLKINLLPMRVQMYLPFSYLFIFIYLFIVPFRGLSVCFLHIVSNESALSHCLWCIFQYIVFIHYNSLFKIGRDWINSRRHDTSVPASFVNYLLTCCASWRKLLSKRW